MPPLNRICILRLSALGDCINAYGLICALLEAQPLLELVWVIDQRFMPLFTGSTPCPRLKIIGVDLKSGMLKALWQLHHELEHQPFDALFNLQTSLKASLCSLCITARLRLGYDRERSREGQFLFINQRVSSSNNPHVLAGFMSFPKSCGLGVTVPRWDFNLTEEERQPFLHRYQGQRIFLIAPASAKRAKNWTVEGYLAVARHAVSQGFFVVLSGGNGPTDLELCDLIAKGLDPLHCDNQCGKTGLRELLALVSCCKLVLSPDSACAHLASALNIPVIGLYAVHDPRRVGTWNFPQLWVSAYQKLAQKELGKRHIPWRYRVRNPAAMAAITSAEVIEAFDRAQELCA